jgi:hypothetical protein
MNNQIDLNKFNTLMSDAADALLCNSECRKEREKEKLKQMYLDAKTNLAAGPSKLQLAQKKYITFSQGEQAYNEFRDKSLEKKAELIANTFSDNFNEEVDKINTQTKILEGLYINYKNVFDLYKKYVKENIILTKKLKEETNDVLTNERKTYYEEQNIDALNFYYFYFILTIYIIVLIAFIVFQFIYPSTIPLPKRIFILFCFIILPFFSTWILGMIVYLSYRLFNLLPKNVYIEDDE